MEDRIRAMEHHLIKQIKQDNAHLLDSDEDGLPLKRACVWAVQTVHVLVQRTCEVLASARVPDLVLSYVFTHNVEENLSSIRPPLTSGVDIR